MSCAICSSRPPWEVEGGTWSTLILSDRPYPAPNRARKPPENGGSKPQMRPREGETGGSMDPAAESEEEEAKEGDGDGGNPRGLGFFARWQPLFLFFLFILFLFFSVIQILGIGSISFSVFFLIFGGCQQSQPLYI